MPDEYEKRIIYAGEEVKPEPLPAEGEKKEKKEKRTADWLLVAVAVIGLGLTIYYIGFDKIKAPENILPEIIEIVQPEENQTIPAENISYGTISMLSFGGIAENITSRDDLNISISLTCNDTCLGKYVSLYDGPNLLGTYQNASSWNGTKTVNISIVVPKRNNAALALTAYADSESAENVVYPAASQVTNTTYFFVLAGIQKVIFGKEFYLDVGETANLTYLNATITLTSISNGVAYISVKQIYGNIFSSWLNLENKQNATFFDMLTLELLDMGTKDVTLVAWPDGLIESISIQSPGSPIGLSTVFKVYIDCTATCAASYVGIHALCETNLTRIGFYNFTEAWSGFKVVNISTTIPYYYQNKTSTIKVLADSRDSSSTYIMDMWNLPEQSISYDYYIE